MSRLSPSKLATAVALAAALVLGSAAQARTQDARQIGQGRAIAVQKCSGCHALGLDDASPNPKAPPFRNLYRRYPVDGLRESFLNGYRVAHAPMPMFKLRRTELDQLLAYLKDLNPCSAPSSDRAAMERCFKPL